MSKYSYYHTPAGLHNQEHWTVDGIQAQRGLYCVFSRQEAVDRVRMLYKENIDRLETELLQLKKEFNQFNKKEKK